jgi:hypothetical protein
MMLLLAPALAWAADGVVVGVVFERDSGAPAAGVAVSAAGASTTTGPDGRFSLTIAPGIVDVRVGDGVVPQVAVASGQTTELLVTWSRAGGVLSVLREEPVDGGPVGARVEGPTAPLSGSLTDEDGAALAGARVVVRGLAADAVSGGDGRFSVQLPIGTWDVTVIRAGYVPVTRTIEMDNDGEALDLTLVASGIALSDFTITAPRVEGGTASLLDERQASSSVSDSVGVEQMSRAGDGNAAAALARVTGLTVVDGKYVYVRGLGERYSSSLLNGAQLPSPEPERRVVPLDMFPPSVLESIVVQKTTSPDLPAEFGGGAVLLRTRSAPSEPFFDLSASSGLEVGSAFTQGLRYEGGPTDWLGIDGGTRALPDVVAEASAESPLEEGDMFSSSGYGADELEAFGEAMSNTWNTVRQSVPPDASVSFGAGAPVELGPTTLSALIGGGWGQSWSSDQWQHIYTTVGSGGALEAGNTYDFDALTRTVSLTGIGVVQWEGLGQRITSTTLCLRDTEDEAREYVGYNRDVGTDIAVTRLRWVERMLLLEQVLGDHRAGPLRLGWRYTFAQATRLEPDTREYRYDLEPQTGEWFLSDRPEGNGRLFSDLDDDTQDIGVDLTLALRPKEDPDDPEANGFVRVGGVWVDRERLVDTRRYKYVHKGELSRADEVLVLDPESIFAAENIGSDGFQFEEITRQTDNYTATQTIRAVYGMIDTPITPSTRVLAGARYEAARQATTTFELFNPDAVPIEALIESKDVLPTATVTQGLGVEGMQVRAGYGKTVSRPDFREQSPATFDDVTGGRQTFGNPDLVRATIDAFDVRWEYYPSAGESVSIAGFYKRFVDPIETVVVVSAQHSVTFDNALGAQNVGVELDGRKDFAFLGPGGADWYVAGNLAIIRSRVQLDADSGIQTSLERPLQGQSPWVANAQVGYADPDGRLALTLLYNGVGPRLVEVGALGAPDTYEGSLHLVDATARFGLGGGFALSLKAKNLIDPPRIERQFDMIVDEIRVGREFGLGLSWSPDLVPDRG